ncbi:MAG: sensor histidine kinase [Candidatus Limnocylindria bacterium]
MAGLLVAIAVIGVVGIVINRNIHQTVVRAIDFDVELEDQADDLRVAILEVRHYHRDLLLNNPSVGRIDAWEDRHEILLEEIASIEAVLQLSPPDFDFPEAQSLRPRAEAYFDAFVPVIDRYLADQDEEAFIAEAEGLLVPISGMADIAEDLDQTGERRATAAFEEIDDASANGTLALLAVMAGLGGIAAVLAVAVLRLVQDQRRLVAFEQAAVAQMAEASRAKTDFIADASHELRTPLTVLRGNAEVGLALQDDCAHGEILAEIVQESARMSRLVDDLLFLARSDAASVPLEPRAIEARELMEGLAGRAEVLARERGATLDATLDCRGSMRVDPGRIEQAILILVDNAAKYGGAGGVVELDARTTAGELVIEVRDRGPGIPPEQLARIFERFYRVDGEGRGRGGSGAGLGLPIAAAIVEGHGGRIEAGARAGGGTVMEVTLPVQPADLRVPEAATEAS